MNAEKTGKILAIVIVLVGVLLAVDTMIKQVPIEDIPEPLLVPWNYILMFFSWTPWITLAAFGRNVWGYVRVYYREHHQEAYDSDKLKETLALYVGGITTVVTILNLLPPPYDVVGSAVASAIIVLVDLVKSEIGHLKEATSP